MYACSVNDPRFIYLNERIKQSSYMQLNAQYKLIAICILHCRENEINIPLCARCHRNFVCIREGRTLKTCQPCLNKVKNYQKEGSVKRAVKTNSVICTTCSRKPAMIINNKQYHTCSCCSNRKKTAYLERKGKIKEDDLPYEILSSALNKKNKTIE